MLSPGDSISVVLKKLLQGGRSGSQAIHEFATEGAGLSEQQRSGIKEFSILRMGRCKPQGSLNSFLSYAPQLPEANPVFFFTLLPNAGMHPSSSAINSGIAVPNGLQFWEPSFTFGGQK